MKRKLFVVSDVHGCFSLMKQALDNASFEPTNDEHLLVYCGDMFDKGLENLKVFYYLIALKNKVIIRGNHEDVLLDILITRRLRNPFYLNGTPDTIREFFSNNSIDDDCNVDFSSNERLRDKLMETISSLPSFYETKSYVFVHGWLPVRSNGQQFQIFENWRTASDEQWKNARSTKWTEMYESCNRLPSKKIVCGHFPTFLAEANKSQKGCPDIFYGNEMIAIDGGTFITRRVNVLVLEDSLIK